ncbi:MAG: hypothetical protein R3268_03210 [Acidiferrobacterales bacterium]|nr:hypothetical protein [Acidiferrobacterales bacterium]
MGKSMPGGVRVFSEEPAMSYVSSILPAVVSTGGGPGYAGIPFGGPARTASLQIALKE